MSVVVIGLNHRTAPLELLERMTVGGDQLSKPLHDLISRENLSEAVILSTCNRTEVYARAERFHGAYADVRNSLSEISHLPPEAFSDHLYSYFDAEAVAHLFSVIAGLDSAVLGENEIQGQVRRSWDVAQAEGTTGTTLNLLFRHAVEAGKRVRTQTGMRRDLTSMSQAAVVMARDHLGSLDGKRVLVVGAGEMGEGMAAALAGAGVTDVRVANRTSQRAEALAGQVGATPVPLLDLPEQLAEVDVVLSSTRAEALVIDEDDVRPAMARRPDQPLLVVDIAVPRDVSRQVAEIHGVTLLDMDDLRAFADAGRAERLREAERARHMLEAELERYREASSAREVAPTIVALREQAEAVRTAEVARFRNRNGHLDQAELDAVDALTKSVVAKLLHEPTVVLKDASGSARGDRLLAALQDLFGVDARPDGSCG